MNPLAGFSGVHAVKEIGSRIFLRISCYLAILAICTGVCCLFILPYGNGWDALVFFLMIKPVAAGTLLLGVVPSAILYFRTRRHRDWVSLWISVGALAALLAEWLAVFLIVLPRGGC